MQARDFGKLLLGVSEFALKPGEAAGVVDHPVLGGPLGSQPLQHDGPVVVVDVEDGVGSVELLDLETGRRTMLAPDGSHPRWLP